MKDGNSSGTLNAVATLPFTATCNFIQAEHELITGTETLRLAPIKEYHGQHQDDGTMIVNCAQFNLTQEIADSELRKPWRSCKNALSEAGVKANTVGTEEFSGYYPNRRGKRCQK